MSLKIVVSLCLLATALAAPPEPTVGFNPPRTEPLIIGGEEADPGEFPWQVSLQRRTTTMKHFCGGVLLNKSWVVTAGHCVLAIQPGQDIYVKAGKHDLSKQEPTEQMSVVAKSWVHEKYAGSVAPYDIALMKLKTPLKMTEAVQPIALPKPNSTPTGEVTLSGWGVYRGRYIMPNILQKYTVPIVPNDECSDAVMKLIGRSKVSDTNVCTGPLTGGKSACNGDSGGPLIQQRSDGSHEVIGLASWVILPCGTRGAPSVYTKVSVFVDWLENLMHTN